MTFTCLPILFGCITFMCPYSYLRLSASSPTNCPDQSTMLQRD